jgi:hypothetical protein
MQDTALFAGVEIEVAAARAVPAEGQLRLRKPDRKQVLLRPCSLEELLSPEHEFRALWSVVRRGRSVQMDVRRRERQPSHAWRLSGQHH